MINVSMVDENGKHEVELNVGSCFTSKFKMQDKVIINGDSSVKATVQGFQVRPPGNMLIEVMWFGMYGDVKEHWFYEYQLEAVK